MNFYETMYIIHPALQAGRLDDMIESIHKKIDSLKGKRLYFDNWGKKKLSYAIDKQKYGTYILMQFSMDGLSLQELSSEFEHNSNILRYLTNRIDENQILEHKEKEVEDSTLNKDETNKEKVDEVKEKTIEKSDEVESNETSNEESDSSSELENSSDNNESEKTEE